MARKPDFPAHNRRVLLAKRPAGIPQATDFVLDSVERPVPRDGQVLIRNIYLSVDPAQRGWASSESNYANPVPLNTAMRALAVGIVCNSRCTEFAEGQFVYGWFGWQDYAVVDPVAILTVVDEAFPLSAGAGLFGINGLTAYLALTELGCLRKGDTLLVSTAAGAVGSLVGQIGHILGCRTVALTGSEAKIGRCLERYGYAEAFNYKTASLDDVMRSAAPNGFDIFFDNAGGRILDAGLRHMAVGGRIIQCGTASVSTWLPAPLGPRNEREVLTKRLRWSGFVIFDHAASFEKTIRQLAAWFKEGLLVCDEDISIGIEHAPSALSELYEGRNSGKRLIDISTA